MTFKPTDKADTSDEIPMATAGERNSHGRLRFGIEIATAPDNLGMLARFRAFDRDGKPCGAQLIVDWEMLEAIRRAKL